MAFVAAASSGVVIWDSLCSDQFQSLLQLRQCEELELSPRDSPNHYDTWIHLSHASTPLVQRGTKDFLEEGRPSGRKVTSAL